MKLNKKGKKILISVTAVILVAAIGVGIWFGTQGSSEAVGVYPFEYLGMTEYWGDTQESYGPVTTDRIQTLFLSDTQTVTEVLVAQGDAVKKGDPLITFDTTLSDLQLERKRLDVEKLKLQLDEAEAELKKIRNMKPMTTPSFDLEMEEPYLGSERKEPYKAFLIEGNDGTTMEKPFVCWLRDDTYVDDDLLESLRRQVWGDQGLCEHGVLEGSCTVCNPTYCKHGNIESECPTCNCTHGEDCELCNKCVHGIIEADCEICNPRLCEHLLVAEACPDCNPPRCIHGTACPICFCEHENDPDTCPECNKTEPETGGEDDAEDGESTQTADNLSASEEKPYVINFLSNTDSGAASGAILNYFVIFKVTEGNMELGATTCWLGVHVSGQGTDFGMNYFIPGIQDYTIPELEEEEEEEIETPDYMGSGYTSAQIAEMRKEQEKKIKELEFKIKMADAEYKIMQKELGDGTVYAEFDGEIVSLLTEEESRELKQPMVKVSGGGGFYIEGSVSELVKDDLEIGQEVTINDWSTGGMYTGTVQSIGDFPSSDNGWNGMDNPNATYYPFTAFVGEEADLQAGSYVSVQYSTSGSTNGIYLEKAFIRTEQGRSYVYALGADGRLEKRYVTTGKSLWGSYLEILSGVTPEDKLAFPYGKNVKEGVKAVESDISDLYMY